MNKSILNPEVQDFINRHLKADISKLLFKTSPFKNITTKELVEHIEAKKRCETKLPLWYSTQQIYYPNKLNIEQTSSEITAKYKSKIISGHSLIDLTSGFGIDSFYFSKQFNAVTSCEINEGLSEITKHNFNILNAHTIKVVAENGLDYIKKTSTKFSCIYVDPSRRHDSKGKVFFLKDCLPNIPENINMLFEYSDRILIKTSPMLDISMGISELKHVKEIHIVAVQNEVKELLFYLELNYSEKIKIETINILKESFQRFSFYKNEEPKTISKISLPQIYLYEPNAALLKSGAFNLIAEQLNISKLHKHTHLYTSKSKIEFPGRVFKIETVLEYNKKGLKRYFKDQKANVSTRNFPATVAQIKKEFNIRDGGTRYVFFTTDLNESKIVIITTKV